MGDGRSISQRLILFFGGTKKMEQLDQPIDECQNKVTDSEEIKLFYCIVTRDYFDQCPPKCPYFVIGSSIPMDLIYQHNFEMECPFFSLIAQLTPDDEKMFTCTRNDGLPQCEQCTSHPLRIPNKNDYSITSD